VCITEPVCVTSNAAVIKTNQNSNNKNEGIVLNRIPSKTSSISLKQSTNNIKLTNGNLDKKISSMNTAISKIQNQVLNKNTINYLKATNDTAAKKKQHEVIEIVDNMAMSERELERPNRTEDRIRKMIAVEIEPHKKDNIYDTNYDYIKESPNHKNNKDKDILKDVKSTKERENSKKEVKEESKKDEKKLSDMNFKDIKDIKNLKEEIKLNYKILGQRELSKPRAKSPVITIKPKNKISSKDVIIFKNININPESFSKKITLDLNIKKKVPESARYQTEVEMKEETQFNTEKIRSTIFDKTEPSSSRIMSSKMGTREKDVNVMKQSGGTLIKGVASPVKTDLLNKESINLILYEKLQKACNIYAYSIKEVYYNS